MTKYILLVITCVSLCFTSCSSPKPFIYNEKVGIEQTTPSGLLIVDEKIGQGAFPTYRCIVNVHMKMVLEDGYVYIDSYKSGQPLSFQLGLNEVIPGVDEALTSMKPGGKRKLIVPPDLAFGSKGVSGKVRPNETIVVYLELIDFRPGR